MILRWAASAGGKPHRFRTLFRNQQQMLQRNSYFLTITSSHIIQTSCITTTSRLPSKPKDFHYEEKMPIYDYGKSNMEKKRMYVFGAAAHGGLGLETLIRPKEEGQRQYLFSWKPVRHKFGETHQITDVVAGHGFTLIAVKPKVENGPIVFGCGSNRASQLGYQAARAEGPLETLLSIVPLPIAAKKTARVLALGAGRAHSLISIEGDGLYAIGDNSSGQCGRSIIEDEEYFGSKYIHRFTRFKDDEIVAIASRYDLSVCVTQSGQVYTFGSNEKGQLGRSRLAINPWEPQLIKGDLEGEKVVKVVTSGSSVLALTENGEVFGWGCNECSQVQPGKISNIYYEPHRLELPKHVGKVRDIAIGDFFAFVLNEQGNIYVWGQGGCLGLGPSTYLVTVPTLVPPPLFGQNQFSPNVQVVSISSSFFYSGAINSLGDLYMWGRDVRGCLGLGRMNHQYFPLKVSIGSAAKKISLGIDHTIVLAKGGF